MLASMAEREESQTKFKSEELPCGTWEKLKEMSKNENNNHADCPTPIAPAYYSNYSNFFQKFTLRIFFKILTNLF